MDNDDTLFDEGSKSYFPEDSIDYIDNTDERDYLRDTGLSVDEGY